MKQFLRIAFFLTLSCGAAWSQTCSVSTFNTQTEVDNFSSSYPGCTVLNGNVNIISTSITNLDSLHNVARIIGTLNINHNSNLISLAGLSSLEQLDGSLNIEDNDNLLTLGGLEHLVRPLQRIRVVYNERLTSIAALSGVTRIRSALSIGANPALTSLNGLHYVTRVFGGVSIALNDNLQDLNGLRRLKQIDWFLSIDNNKSLRSLKGLEHLESLVDRLEITGNNVLTSISEIAQLKSATSVIIKNNPLLSVCTVKIVCVRSTVGDIQISGNAAGCSTNEEVRMSTTCTPQTLVRINAGGPAFTTATQKLFVADQYYAGIDRTSSIESGDILNTTNDVLYRSGRCSPSFSYNIPVVNDQLNVILHFAETYFGAPGKKGGAGSRQFHVNIEGSRKVTNYDIFAEAGGALRAVQLTIPVTVTDGVLNIDFLTGAADLPRVSAIEVIASPTLIPVANGMVNKGVYININYLKAKHLYVEQAPSGDNPNLNWLSYLKFQLPTGKAAITSAKLRIYGNNQQNNKSITIHAYGVNDDSWTEATLTGENAPAASTLSLGFATVNDVYKYYEIDVTSYVNAQRQSGDALISFLLSDPNKGAALVDFNSKETGANPPQLVYQTTNIVPSPNTIARVGQEELFSKVQEKHLSSVFPNPARDHFALEISPSHTGKVDLKLISITGREFQLQPVRADGNFSQLEVSLPDNLPGGLYLLNILSNEFSELTKVLIAD